MSAVSNDIIICNWQANFYEKGDLCAAFLWNNHTHETKTMRFRGKEHQVPPRSISILPDCKTLVYNTDYVSIINDNVYNTKEN